MKYFKKFARDGNSIVLQNARTHSDSSIIAACADKLVVL